MIDYEEDWLASVIFRWRGSVVPRVLWIAVPSACLAPFLLWLDDVAPDLRGGIGIEALASSVFWNATSACVLLLVGFRSRQALGRFWEGTGLLHQMRGEWFDAVSCLMTFSRGARGTKSKEVAEFRQSLVRLMSLMHGSALEEIQGGQHDLYEVIDINGLDIKTRNYLKECKDTHGFNRVEVLLHMVQVLVTDNLDTGVLKIAPPILSRVYQTLSRGLVNLLNARKITDTKFPFPYVQLITVLLVFYSVLTPVVMTGLIDSKAWAALFTFFPVFGLFSLNAIAVELECPFGEDENDLPLKHFQSEMNSSLLMLIMDEADHLVHTSKTAILDHRGLRESVSRSSTDTLMVGVVESKNSRDAVACETETRLATPEMNSAGADTARSIELAVQVVEEAKSQDKVLEQTPAPRAIPPAETVPKEGDAHGRAPSGAEATGGTSGDPTRDETARPPDREGAQQRQESNRSEEDFKQPPGVRREPQPAIGTGDLGATPATSMEVPPDEVDVNDEALKSDSPSWHPI